VLTKFRRYLHIFHTFYPVKLLVSSVTLPVKDRDNSLARQRELEREIELLKERLDASQAGWAEARSSLEDRERQAVECGDARLQAFQRSLAELLSDSCVIVDATEDRILQRIRELLYDIRDKTAVSINAGYKALTGFRLGRGDT